MPSDFDITQLATTLIRFTGLLCIIGGAALLLIRGISAWGRLPWSYIGSFVRESVIAPSVSIVIGCILLLLAGRLGGWISK